MVYLRVKKGLESYDEKNGLMKWTIPVTRKFNEQVVEFLKDSIYSSKAEFIRDVVRKYLESETSKIEIEE